MVTTANVGKTERGISMAVGSALLAQAFRRRTPLGAALGLGGLALLAAGTRPAPLQARALSDMQRETLEVYESVAG